VTLPAAWRTPIVSSLEGALVKASSLLGDGAFSFFFYDGKSIKKNEELDVAGRDISSASGRSRRIVVRVASPVAELSSLAVRPIQWEATGASPSRRSKVFRKSLLPSVNCAKSSTERELHASTRLLRQRLNSTLQGETSSCQTIAHRNTS
jgi:hypothetical protein